MIALFILLFACATASASPLFNGHDFSGWYTYLRGKGVNNDPDRVFRTNGAGNLYVSGEGFGYLASEREYCDYRLTFDYRWCGTGWGPRARKAPDSGILYHAHGPDGVIEGVWMRSFECNVIVGRCCDHLVVGVEGENVRATSARLDAHGRWDPNGTETRIVDFGRVDNRFNPPNLPDTDKRPITPPERAYGEWNHIEILCRGDTATYWLNGVKANEVFGLQPTRGRILIQCEGHAVEYRNLSLEPLTDAPDGLPFVDLSQETNRHSFVARGTPETYQGHPTTALMDDGRTMFCVWPTGHGGQGGNLARSDDAGRHWRDASALLPREAKRHVNCPCLHHLVAPDGHERLIYWSAFLCPDEATAAKPYVWSTDALLDSTRAMPAVASDDGGKSWHALPPLGAAFRNILPFQGIVRLKDGSYLGVYHRGPQGCCDRGPLEVLASVTKDGGLSWSAPTVIAKDARWDLCEPWVFRSPDGAELCCVLRENRRTGTSKAVFSRDEGRSWSAIRDLPPWLTGDRHQGVTLPDGRLVIVYRSQEANSVLKNHFIAWVGTYAELKSGKAAGCYHVKLLHSFARWDCGYPGIHLLSDGTVVATTYVKYDAGPDCQSVVTTRFKVSETDRH